MAERTISFPAHPFRWLAAPAFVAMLAALLAAVAARIRHAQQPALPRMSDEWLRSYNAQSRDSGEFWRDSW